MASYPRPISIVPIFSPNLFPTENTPLFQGQANNLYIQTANVNQSSGGTKTFSDLRSSDIAFTAPGKPLRWESGSGFGISRLTPIPSVLFDKSYRLPVDDNYAIEELVGRQSSQTLINKTLGSLKVGTNGTSFTDIRNGSNTSSTVTIAPQFTANITVSFSPAFASSPRVLVTNSVVGAGVGGLNFLLLTVRDITTTGCTIVCANTHPTFTFNGTIRADWVAWI